MVSFEVVHAVPSWRVLGQISSERNVQQHKSTELGGDNGKKFRGDNVEQGGGFTSNYWRKSIFHE